MVTRVAHGRLEYLLVEASRARGVWVLPKGHIERGETAEAAAVREVEEEGGVHAEIISEAGDSEYVAAGKQVRTIFYVMRYVSDARSDEVRGRAWHQYEDAHRILQFDNLRRVLAHAHALAGNLDPDRTA